MRQNKRTIVWLLVFVFLIMAITLAASHRQREKLAAGEERIKVLQEAIDQENIRTEEITEKQKYMQSDEYKELVAKEKLGLIRDGDIIFKEAEQD